MHAFAREGIASGFEQRANQQDEESGEAAHARATG